MFLRTHEGLAVRGLLVALTLVAAWPAVAEAQTVPETFEGQALDTSAGARATAFFTIRVDEYTTDAERQELITVLAYDGWQGLEQALRDVNRSSATN